MVSGALRSFTAPSWVGARQGTRSLSTTRRFFKRYEAFDAHLDKDALDAARVWFKAFDASRLPKGHTTYARSSGPGGQHVNKTESKAISVFPVKELLAILPETLHSSLRSSKYYTAGSDSLTFHAQTSRSRDANAQENRDKLMDEIMRVYRERTPAETSPEKRKKHDAVERRFNENRVKDKKLHSSKKQRRQGM